MSHGILDQYAKMVHFLADMLGPDYEVVLHDVSNKENSIIAIANGYISGRNLGAPLTSHALQIIASKSYIDADYRINYVALTKGKKKLRSSTFFIKDAEQNLIGLFCINFDDAKYQNLATKILQLCHPDAFVERNIVYSARDYLSQEDEHHEETESLQNSIPALTEETVMDVVRQLGMQNRRLSKTDKLKIIAALEKKGTFLLKGAVGLVADAIYSSEASVYRYLNTLNKEE